ncbi:MAG: FxsA family protein [Gammaproteobacteria bacterium]|nr:FxsA family protein [Gammaproteobacteria bacterium]
MNPLLIFLLIFVGVPLVELYFLIEVGSEIGAISTIALTVFTAVLGGMLVRMQGFTTALKVRDALEREEVPAIEMMEGAILLVTGLMLLLPGFVTDAIGFLLLVPPVRQALLLRYLRASGVMQSNARRNTDSDGVRQEPKVIEGEYHRVDRE